ncbi:porphobilinogen synthase [candidate division GN15 bacterium]|nr:porphobilinogen synthase [candidate division GN15 bacterium]
MSFPEDRPRRLRRTEAIRRLVAETTLSPSDFIYPLFVAEGLSESQPIASMPGVNRWPLVDLGKQARHVYELGIPGVILFGIPRDKDAEGSSSLATEGIVQRSIREIKDACPDLIVMTDVCLCEYTDHGHCGIIHDGDVDNDATLEVLAQQAVSHATAGADFVAPSDMMDGRVGIIRDSLDESGFDHVGVMAYSAKYCSAFYGPFRDAADSAPQFGDRRTYQMDPPNAEEALREISFDLDEGADIVMVKPALPYLDIMARARQTFVAPLAAYNVSGEYSMVKLAAEKGLADEKRLVMEVLTSIKRAGADIIISYHALQAAEWLRQ